MSDTGSTASGRKTKSAGLKTAAFFKQEAFSDLTIRLSDREIRAHKLILSTKCERFNAIIADPASYKDSKSNVIEFKAENPDAIEALLCFLYSNEYLPDSPAGFKWNLHFDIAIVAHQFGVTKMKARAIKEFGDYVSVMTDSEEMMQVLHKHACYPDTLAELDEVVYKLVDANFVSLFDLAPFRDLQNRNLEQRNILFEKHLRALIGKPEFRAIMQADANLGLRLVNLLTSDNGLKEKRLGRCARCNEAKIYEDVPAQQMIPSHHKLRCTAYIARSSSVCGGRVKFSKCWVKEDRQTDAGKPDYPDGSLIATAISLLD